MSHLRQGNSRSEGAETIESTISLNLRLFTATIPTMKKRMTSVLTISPTRFSKETSLGAVAKRGRLISRINSSRRILTSYFLTRRSLLRT